MFQIPRQVITIILVAALNHVGLSIPRADETVIEREVTSNVKVYDVLHRNLLGSSGVMLAKFIMWSTTTIQLARAFALELPYSSLGAFFLAWLPDNLLGSSHSADTGSPWALPGLAGLTLILSGAALNLSSRYTLGAFASYPIIPSSRRMLYVPPSLVSTPNEGSTPNPKAAQTWALRHSHVLITSGPYSYVRHPMYLGVLLSFMGSGIIFLNKRSLLGVLMSNMIVPTYRAVPPTLFLILGLSTAVDLAGRAKREDAALDSAFGKGAAFFKWRIPYSFIPGIY